MKLLPILLLITSFIGVFLGSLVLSKDPRNKKNQTFFILCILISAWYFSLPIMLTTTNVDVYNLFMKIGLVGINFVAVPYILFIFDLLKIKNNKLILLIFAVSVFNLYLLLNNRLTFTHYFSGKLYYSWGIYPKAGLGEIVNAVVTCSGITACIICLLTRIQKVKRSVSPLEFTRFKYIATALTIFGFGAIDYLPKFGIDIYPIGFLFFLIFAGIISYSIIKHNLMDINIVVRRGLVYSILATLITIIYFTIVFLAENLFRGLIGYKSIPLTLMNVAIFIMLFQPLKNRVQTFVDRFFFKRTQEEVASENERLMEELHRSEKLKAVGTLAAGMAHEIKNPLSAIKTFTEYLPEKYNDPSFRDKFNRIVGGEVEKINAIVSQLLNFAKPKSLNLKNIEMHSLLDDTLNLLNNNLIRGKINVEKNYAPYPLNILADSVQLKQVLLNLFLNAIDAMPKGGKLIISTNKEDNMTQIVIQDTGCGIPAKHIPRLFDPFFTTKEDSTGLGLANVHSTIKKHNGSIVVESQVGKGTKFTIKL